MLIYKLKATNKLLSSLPASVETMRSLGFFYFLELNLINQTYCIKAPLLRHSFDLLRNLLVSRIEKYVF